MKEYLKHYHCYQKLSLHLSVFSFLLLMMGIMANAQTRTDGSFDILSKKESGINITLSIRPTYPKAKQVVQFEYVSQNRITYWEWDLGDGNTSNVQNPRLSYSKPGYYSVTLTVANPSGKRRAWQTIGVMPRPDASFSYSRAFPKIGQLAQFMDTSSGSPTSWLWHFGDGTTSTSQYQSHAYRIPTSFTVTLLAGSVFNPERVSRTLTISAANRVSSLLSSFTRLPDLPAPGQTVQFINTTKGTPTSWPWVFNDGSTSTAQNPNHTFETIGAYNVTLTATDDTGSPATSSIIDLGYAEVITAASASFADVSAAVNRAKAGNTVIVPAGSATWDSQLVITKGIILKGAGSGNTLIASNYEMGQSGNPPDESNYLVVYKPDSPSLDESFRLSGFTFNAAKKCRILLIKNYTTTPIRKIRIDHNTFSNPAGDYLFVVGTVYGVADSNTFNGGVSHFYGVGNNTWKDLTFKLGSADNFYLEDNVFNGSGTKHAGESSGRYCVRHNVYNLTGESYPLCDVHGNQPAAGCGMMGIEVYDNTINAGSYGMTIIDQRGGRVVVYNNNAITAGSVTLKVREEYHDSINPPQASPDGQPQYPSSSYYWGNKRNGTPLTTDNPYVQSMVDYGGSLGLVPRENRDFWNENPRFNGRKGIGVGLLSSRPATGKVGVGYWAIDTKTLYRYTINNVWEEYYKPYIYPHPLRSLL